MTLVPADSMDAWQLIVQQADVLARSSIVPRAYQRKPDDIIAAALFGRGIGLSVTTSLVLIDVIEGNPTLNAEGKVATTRAAGHSIEGEVTADHATVTGKRADTGDTMTVTFSMADAQRAGLASKDVWKKYPGDMMWSRAVSALCRRLFPDVCIGLSYTPEEVQAFTGQLVDADTGEIVQDCPECGLPLPGPHRGTCSVSLMSGGPGVGRPSELTPPDRPTDTIIAPALEAADSVTGPDLSALRMRITGDPNDPAKPGLPPEVRKVLAADMLAEHVNVLTRQIISRQQYDTIVAMVENCEQALAGLADAEAPFEPA